MKKQKINLVLGASGRIGFPLCLELKQRGEYVRAMVRSNSHITEKLKTIVDEVVYGDILDKDSLIKAFNNVDIVYHLAAIVSIESKPSPILLETNITGTKNVIDACIITNVDRLIYTSSVHAIHFENKTQTLIELDKYYPDKVKGEYEKTKAIAANLVLDAVKDNGLDAVIALPSGVIGPYEYSKSNIGQMIENVAKGKFKVTIKGQYDFVDVRDVSSALCDLGSLGIKGESYIISGYKCTVKNMLCMVADSANVKRPFIPIPLWLVKMFAPFIEKRSLKRGEKPTVAPHAIAALHDNCNFSHDKLTDLTGYNPRTLDISLKDQTDFYLNEIKQKSN